MSRRITGLATSSPCSRADHPFNHAMQVALGLTLHGQPPSRILGRTSNDIGIARIVGERLVTILELLFAVDPRQL